MCTNLGNRATKIITRGEVFPKGAVRVSMLILSKFPGECLSCHKEIRVGDRVSWLKGRKGVEHAACSDEGKALVPKLEASRAVSSDVEFPVPDGLSYLGYQKAGIAFALAHPGTIIADEMGLGKTVQAIGVINASPDVRRVLIVCPASLKLNWRNECKKWLTRPELSVQLWSRDFTKPGEISDLVCIINYDMLKKLPTDATWDLLILDEAHYVKNPKSQRTKLVGALKKRCARVIALTGTPILNKPIELWPILQIVASEAWDPAGFMKGRSVGAGEGAGFFRFAKRYCAAHEVWFGHTKHWDFTGASNLDELQEKLRSTCMVRRLKQDVLKELPAKRRQTIELEIDADEELDAERTSWGDSDFEPAKARQRIQFTEISSARAALAVKKAPAVAEHVIDALEGGSEKIVLFAHHREVITALEAALVAYNPLVITGETPTEARQLYVERFQSNGTHRVIIGSIGAMGVGLTLTAASHVIFAELDWTPANVTQAEDRCHRIGQTESVLVQHLVVKGSLDARMVELLIQKQEIADLALDEETLEDVSDRALVEKDPVVDALMLEALKISALVHMQLRYLAACCDGAQARDDSGFNKLDAPIGKRLATLSALSPRQALLGQKIVRKYKRQLEGLSL